MFFLLKIYNTKHYQIQKKFTDFELIAIQIIVHKGKILNHIEFFSYGELKHIDYFFNRERNVLDKLNKNVIHDIELICKHFNGIMELEYILKDNNYYIMECNPRISGYYRMNSPIYNDNIFKPYINIFRGLKYKIINKYRNKKTIINRPTLNINNNIIYLLIVIIISVIFIIKRKTLNRIFNI